MIQHDLKPDSTDDPGPLPSGRFSGYIGPSCLLTLMYLFALACIGYAALHSRGIL